MHYYFDESGNWQEIGQDKFIVMGGVVIDDRYLRTILNSIKNFKTENKYPNIHLTDIKDFSIRDKLFEILIPYIETQQIKTLGYVVDTKQLLETKKSKEDIYLGFASQLLSEITFGDNDIHIETDMIFKFDYKENVLNNMFESQNKDFEMIKKFLTFNKERFEQYKYRVLNGVFKNNPYIAKQIEKDGWLYEYMWTEFRLRIEKSFTLREILKDRIMYELLLKSKNFGLHNYLPKIEIQYKSKWEHNVDGVEIADILNNLIFNGIKGKTSSIGKKLFNKLTIKEIK